MNEAELAKRLRAMDLFILAYEREHGDITDDEINAATRATRDRALAVGGDEAN